MHKADTIGNYARLQSRFVPERADGIVRDEQAL